MTCLLYVLLCHGFVTSVAVFIPTTNDTDEQIPNTDPTYFDLVWNTTNGMPLINTSLEVKSDTNDTFDDISAYKHPFLNGTDGIKDYNLQTLKPGSNKENSTFSSQLSGNSSTNTSLKGSIQTNRSSLHNVQSKISYKLKNSAENNTDFINGTESRSAGFFGYIISRIVNSSDWLSNSTHLPLGNYTSDFMETMNKSEGFVWANHTTSASENPVKNRQVTAEELDIKEATDDLQDIKWFNDTDPSMVEANTSQIAGSWASLNYSTGSESMMKALNDTGVSSVENKFSIRKDSVTDKTNISDLTWPGEGFHVNRSVSTQNVLHNSKNRSVFSASAKSSILGVQNINITEAVYNISKLSTSLDTYVTGTESTSKARSPTASANSIKIPVVVTLNPIIKHHYSGVVQGILLEGFKHNTWDNQVPVDDDPFGSLIWRDRKYLISVLVPIGVGITGAVVIVIVAYVVRSYKRKLKRRAFTSPSRIFRPQAQLAIMDDVLLLDDSSDDGF